MDIHGLYVVLLMLAGHGGFYVVLVAQPVLTLEALKWLCVNRAEQSFVSFKSS